MAKKLAPPRRFSRQILTNRVSRSRHVGGNTGGNAIMARLDTIGFNELAPTLRILSDAGITPGDADWLRTPDNAKKFRAFLDGEYELANRNPFHLSIAEILK